MLHPAPRLLPVPLLAPFVLVTCLLAACAATSPETQASEPDFAQVRGVAPRFQAAFETLRVALEAGDDDTARAIHDRLERRIQVEVAAGAGQQRAEARAAQKLVDGFARVLDGRLRCDALTARLTTRDAAEHPGEFELLLEVESAWTEPLVLRSGAATLQLTRIFVTPMGRQAQVTRNQVLDELGELGLAPGETTRVALGRFPARLTNDVIAAETRLTAALRTVELIEEEERFPGQTLELLPALRVDLAHFLPNAPVEPEELARYLERPDVSLPPVMERAVRIAPERRGEALRGLLPLLERATDRQFERMAPALQWLAPGGPGAAGRLDWRRWIAALDGSGTPASR